MKEEMKSKIEEVKSKVKGGFGWLISGAVIAIVIGFAWGGWVTASTNQKMNGEAVFANQAAICVAQVAKIQQYLKNLRGWKAPKRWEFIEKGGYPCNRKKDRSQDCKCKPIQFKSLLFLDLIYIYSRMSLSAVAQTIDFNQISINPLLVILIYTTNLKPVIIDEFFI